MSQTIKQAPFSARVGEALGNSLAEQIPREVEHYRHRQGLNELAEQSGKLNPAQFLAKAAGVYGVTPQEIQSFGEIAKQQNTRSGYKNYAEKNFPKSTSDLSSVKFANLAEKEEKRGRDQEVREARKEKENFGRNVPSNEYNPEQIVENNPLRDEAIPKKRWTPEERNLRRNENYQDFPWMTPQEINEMTRDDEERYLSDPVGEQQKDSYLKEKQNEFEQRFDKVLETKLQKKGEGVYKDITGEMLSNLRRGAEKELRTNPKATVDNVVNSWTNKALEMQKSLVKNQIETKRLNAKITTDDAARDITGVKTKDYQKSLLNLNKVNQSAIDEAKNQVNEIKLIYNNLAKSLFGQTKSIYRID